MARPLVSLISLIFLAGAILLQFFVILAGGINSNPVRDVYFLQADTSGIPGAKNPARWTYWAVCGVSDAGHNTDCGKPTPAFPFYPQGGSNFNTESGLPEQFIGTRKFYYLSRFAWVFFLLALLFAVLAFFTSALALCTRIGAIFTSLNCAIALFFQTLAAALMTAWTVEARNAFRSNNTQANLGRYAYGFVWAAVALLFLATIFFCTAGGRSSRKDRDVAPARSSRRGFFGKRRYGKEAV